MHSSRYSIILVIALCMFSPIQVAHAAIEDGMVSFWGLNESSGSRTDSGVGSNTLSVTNGSVSGTTGKVGTSAQFTSGSTGYLSVANNSSFNTGGGDFSISAWVYLDNLTGTQVFVSKYSGGGYALYYEPLSLAFIFTTYTGGGVTTGTALGQPNTGTWYHLVGVHDGTANTNTLRINDQYQNVTTSVTDEADTSGAFTIGAFSNGAYIVNGRVDAVGFWNRTLTGAEITSLYNSGTGIELTGAPDTTPPSVSLTAPTEASTVSGATVSLSATASDAGGMAGVKFYVDGTLQGTEDTSLPYSMNWDSTATTTGTHTVFAVARDISNNYATSTVVSVTVDNSAAAFTTTWKTDNTGVSASNQITIPTQGSGYNYNIDWGDSHVSVGVTGNATHTYASPGTYTVSILGTFPGIYFNGGGDRRKILTVEHWGNVGWTFMNNAFEGASNLTDNATDTPDISAVTDMSSMFKNATAFNGDISGWNTSSVTDMSQMFSSAASFNQNLSSWDVSKVTTMDSMFWNAASFNGDVSTWVTSSSTYTGNMFSGDVAFNQDISSWDVSHVTNMDSMFYNDSAFNQAIGGWNVSNVTYMGNMFSGASSFNQDISSWDLSKVTSMNSMFYNDGVFNQPIGLWSVSSTTDMSYMFSGASAFNHDISSWDVSNVTTMNSMFYNDSAFNQDISGWTVGAVTNMRYMFSGDTAFDQDLSSWDVSQVTAMDSMFYGDTLSTTNYDALLAAWSLKSLKNSVTFGAGNSTYCSSSSQRADIINNFGWTISDGGRCPTSSSSTTTSNSTFSPGAVMVVDSGPMSISSESLREMTEVRLRELYPERYRSELIPSTGTSGILEDDCPTGNLFSIVTGMSCQNQSSVTSTTSSKILFNKDRRLADEGDDVLALQKFLNANRFVLAERGAGAPGKETMYFGTLTQKALIKFQEANREKILTPVGLRNGSGIFGPSTRAFINNTK